MKYVMTPREKILLGILAVLAVGAAYFFLFLSPLQQKKAECLTQTASVEDTILLAEAKKAKMNKMEQELEEIFAQEIEEIREVPEYDNSKKLIQRLHLILSATEKYSITFTDAEAENQIVRRTVMLAFDCATYEEAKDVLTKLRDCEYPCVLQDLTMNHKEGYSVNVVLVFFEYQK